MDDNTLGVAQTVSNISLELLLYVGNYDNWSRNLVFSSPSLFHLLSMLQVGSKAQTYDALFKVTGINFNSLLQACDTGSNYFKIKVDNATTTSCYLDVNNCVFSGCDLEQDYTSNVNRLFNATVQHVNFSDVKSSVAIIDQWISKVTNNLIQKMMERAGCIQSDTLLVLVSTAFFRAKWMYPFDKNRTIIGEFYQQNNTSTSVVPVHYMNQTNYFQYFHDNECDIRSIKLPFNNQQFSAVVILPPMSVASSYNDIFKAEIISKTLTNLENAYHESVRVSLPKFSFDYDLNLKQFLSNDESNGGKNLGIIFDQYQCNFQGITTKQPIVVSEILQSAKIIVDEEETVAAVSTAAVMNRCCMPVEPLTFNANRPFLYLIWDNKNHSPLFTAFVQHPNE